jgi:hypothetical protein
LHAIRALDQPLDAPGRADDLRFGLIHYDLIVLETR